MKKERPTSILDTRVPQPYRYEDYGVPKFIGRLVDRLLTFRNTCSDANVYRVDWLILKLLYPWTRK